MLDLFIRITNQMNATKFALYSSEIDCIDESINCLDEIKLKPCCFF